MAGFEFEVEGDWLLLYKCHFYDNCLKHPKQKLYFKFSAIYFFIADNLIIFVYLGNAIEDKLYIEKLNQCFNNNRIINSGELLEFYRAINPAIPKNTVNWRIFTLVEKGVLSRKARGKFVIGSSIPFKPTISPRMKKANRIIQRKFPFVDFCIWEANILKEFTHHQINIDFTIIEIERSSSESIYYQLKNSLNPITFKPTVKEFDNMLEGSKPFYVLQPLISEAPYQNIDGINTTTIEKLLVDVFCDEIWENIRGNELYSVFNNVFSKYSINQSKLLRYADRKGRKDELLNFLSTNKLAID